jgi:hypothetical protein
MRFIFISLLFISIVYSKIVSVEKIDTSKNTIQLGVFPELKITQEVTSFLKEDYDICVEKINNYTIYAVNITNEQKRTKLKALRKLFKDAFIIRKRSFKNNMLYSKIDIKKEEKIIVYTDEEKKIISIGKAASLLLGSTLQGKVKKELQKKKKNNDEKVGLIYFCSDQSKKITDEVNNVLPDGVKVKRITSKYRSHLNKPKKEDMETLNYFEKRFTNNPNATKNIFKLVKTNNGYNYYHPIFIKKRCLSCHGDKKNINSEISAITKRLFPKDKAHGYHMGDFRGLIAVEINKSNYK